MRTRVTLVIGAVLSSPLLVGCGGGSPSPGPASSTSPATSAAFSMADAVAALKDRQTGHFHLIAISQGAPFLTDDGDYDLRTRSYQAMQKSDSSGDRDGIVLQSRLIHQTLYLRRRILNDQLEPPSCWFTVPLAKIAGAIGSTAAEQSAPGPVTAVLTARVHSAEREGNQVRAEVDAVTAMTLLGLPATAVAPVQERLTGHLSPVTFYLDDGALVGSAVDGAAVLKSLKDVALDGQIKTFLESVSSILQFSDLGVPVAVDVPPPAELAPPGTTEFRPC